MLQEVPAPLADAPAVRARIGLIIPSSNRLTEPQMRGCAPSGVEVHVTRLRMTGASHVPLAELLPRIVEATLALDDARCDAIVFHCTASSMEAGLAGEQQVLAAMRAATRSPVATTASACLAAFEALGVSRLALFSPYIAATHAHEIAFLAEAGLSVVGGTALGLAGGDAYLRVLPAEWLQLCLELTPPEAEAVFLSCTNVHTLPIIAAAETRLERPVVSSNQAVLWDALRRCGLQETLPSLGRLFQHPPATSVSSVTSSTPALSA